MTVLYSGKKLYFFSFWIMSGCVLNTGAAEPAVTIGAASISVPARPATEPPGSVVNVADTSAGASAADATVSAAPEAGTTRVPPLDSPVTGDEPPEGSARKDVKNATSTRASDVVADTPASETPETGGISVSPEPSPVTGEQLAGSVREDSGENGKDNAVFQSDSEEQRRSYASGVALARYIDDVIAQQKELHITLRKDIMLKAISDTFNHQGKMSEQDVNATLQTLDEQIKILIQDRNSKRAVADNAWLKEFSERDGVKKTGKGLLYLIKNKGKGAELKETDTVEVSYQGTLIDGVVVNEPQADGTHRILRVVNLPPVLHDCVKLIRKGGEVQLVITPAVDVSSGSVKQDAVIIYTLSATDVNIPE